MATQVDLFEDVDNQYTARIDKPIWALNLDDKNNEKEVHQWLWGELEYLKEENRERLQRVLRCNALVRGVQYAQQETREERFVQTATQIQKITVNQMHDLVQQKVARLIKYRPGIVVLPNNDEFQDKLAAENVEAWLQHVWYTQKFDGVLQPEFVRAAKVDGEAFLFVEWDKDQGDYVAEFDQGMQDKLSVNGQVPLTDDQGKPVLDSSGNPVIVTGPVYKGDVVYKFFRTTECLYERKQKWDDVDYIFRKELYSVEEARILWPDAVDNIVADENGTVYDAEKFQVRKTRKNEVVIWRFFHRRHKALDKGREIVFTHKGIVENKPLKVKHRRLPCARLVDVQLNGEASGYSGVNLISGMHGVYNNATNSIIKNQMLVAHPKWIVPAGTVKMESLGNDITIVQYKGPIPPQLMQMNPTSPEMFQFRETIKQEMQQVYGIYGVSRGDPPPGIKAGVALQFLSEQESERQNEDILRYNEWLKDVAELTVAVAAVEYTADEPRMIRMMGKDKAWTVRAFNPEHLHKAYDIRVQNSSALPQSKAAKTQTLMDLAQQFPDQLPGDLVLDMLDLAQDDKFLDMATVSVRTAEAENEGLTNPESQIPVGEPQEFEDHIKHWTVHALRIRSWDYKHRLPKKQQQLMRDHILAHEFLMAERAKLIPEYQEQLKALAGFPLFYRDPSITRQDVMNAAAQPSPMDMGAMPPQGAPPAGPMQETPGLPVTATEGQIAEPAPSMETQMAGEPVGPPEATPIQPSGAI